MAQLSPNLAREVDWVLVQKTWMNRATYLLLGRLGHAGQHPPDFAGIFGIGIGIGVGTVFGIGVGWPWGAPGP
jgi:hypothetical protein